MNLDTMSFTVTAPGAAGTLCTSIAGGSATIRAARPDSSILLLAAWTYSQLAGNTQIVWPSGHDLVRGVNYINQPSVVTNKLGKGWPASFKPQDPVTVTEVGSAVAGDVELVHMLTWYEDLPGVAGRLITLKDLRERGVRLTTDRDSITATAASTYSAPRTIVASADLLKADTDYAIIGANLGAACGALTIYGADSGNMRFSIPGSLVSLETADWFIQLAEWTGVPCIPVFNSANRAATFIECVQNENLAAVPFSLNMVELAPARKRASTTDAKPEVVATAGIAS